MRLLWVPHASWYIPQRAHGFCRVLAEQHDVHVTDLVTDLARARDLLSRRYVRSMLPRVRRDGPVIVHGVPRVSPSLRCRRLRALNLRLASRAVERIIDEHSIDAVVGTFVVPPPRAPRLAFDLYDDNTSRWQDAHPTYAAEIRSVESAYLREADVVLAASPPLFEFARAAGAKDIRFVPNGVSLARAACADPRAVRAQIGWDGPLVGSVGNHDDPRELELLLGVGAQLRRDGVRLLIAGRGAAVAAARRRGGGTFFLEDVPIDRAPDVVAALDVGLLPYVGTAMDEARSPMRLLLYAAVGVPTVCTDLEHVRALGFPNVVLARPEPEAFASAIRTALALPRGRPAEVERFDIRALAADVEKALGGRSSD